MIRTDGWLDDVPRTGTNRDLLDYLPHPDGYLDYQAGHGSFVAGIVQRVAPTARIRMYQAADTDGFADDVAVADAIRQAVAQDAKIINLSLGMVTEDNVPPPELKDAIEEVARKGVVVVAAAGNFGDETTCWPAAFAEVVAVGALIETEEVGDAASTQRTGKFEAAPWSSKGGYVDLWTVAEGVRSTFVTGRESPLFDKNQPAVFPENAWALWSGTSFAAPQIAGAIARIQQEQGLTARAAVDFLRDQGAQVKDRDGNFKSGRGLRILSGIPIPAAERPIPPAEDA
jgi:subtilisin family serine protease